MHTHTFGRNTDVTGCVLSRRLSFSEGGETQSNRGDCETRCLFFVHSRQTPGSPDPDRFVVAKIFTTKSIDRWNVRIQWTHHRGSPRKRNIAGRARKLNIKPLGQRHAQPSLAGWLADWLVGLGNPTAAYPDHSPATCLQRTKRNAYWCFKFNFIGLPKAQRWHIGANETVKYQTIMGVVEMFVCLFCVCVVVYSHMLLMVICCIVLFDHVDDRQMGPVSVSICLFTFLAEFIFLVVVANGAAVTPNCESPNWPPPSAWHWRLMRTQPVQIIARMWHKITSVAL